MHINVGDLVTYRSRDKLGVVIGKNTINDVEGMSAHAKSVQANCPLVYHVLLAAEGIVKRCVQGEIALNQACMSSNIEE